MKALVAIKRVVDYQVKIRVKSDGSGIETQNVKMSMNPFDEIAIEQAVQFKEQGAINEVIVVSVGGNDAQESLRQALAIGADRAILIKTERALQPLEVANTLKVIAEREAVGLVLLGKQAIDNDCNQTGQMLAALLDWPQGTFASKLELHSDQVLVTREIDDGLETLRLQLPAVITTDLRLNTPRYASLPNIMKAKAMPLAVEALESLAIPNCAELTRIHVEPPVNRESGPILSSIKEIMNTLKEKEGVLP